MKTVLWSAFFAATFVEILALSFRFKVWRHFANVVEYAALTFAETQDERTKEKLIVSASFNLFGLAFYVLAIVVLLFFLLSTLVDLDTTDADAFVWVASALVIMYAWLRTQLLERWKAKQSDANFQFPQVRYNRISRWLHWIALELDIVRTISFEIEKLFFQKKVAHEPRIIDEPVYVMGLARSGTTIVLEILEKTGAFHSQTYRDMPFVLCPNLWQALTKYSRLNPHMATRAHGDGIAIGFDSPESFEEVFWRTFCDTQPGNALAYTPITKDTLYDFDLYRHLILLSATSQKSGPVEGTKKIRYLSKNNNNVLRMNELSSKPNARLVLMIRDPLATAWSLYKQHQRFTKLQDGDIYIRAYMRWLGHHEFGQGHKPLIIGTQHLEDKDSNQPNYWLTYWIGVYENLWQRFNALSPAHRGQILWMSHDHLCQNPKEELARLFRFAKIDQNSDSFISMIRPNNPDNLTTRFDLNLASNARSLHREILQLSKV